MTPTTATHSASLVGKSVLPLVYHETHTTPAVATVTNSVQLVAPAIRAGQTIDAGLMIDAGLLTPVAGGVAGERRRPTMLFLIVSHRRQITRSLSHWTAPTSNQQQIRTQDEQNAAGGDRNDTV